jgi:hypothetical protein
MIDFNFSPSAPTNAEVVASLAISGRSPRRPRHQWGKNPLLVMAHNSRAAGSQLLPLEFTTSTHFSSPFPILSRGAIAMLHKARGKDAAPSLAAKLVRGRYRRHEWRQTVARHGSKSSGTTTGRDLKCHGGPKGASRVPGGSPAALK